MNINKKLFIAIVSMAMCSSVWGGQLSVWHMPSDTVKTDTAKVKTIAKKGDTDKKGAADKKKEEKKKKEDDYSKLIKKGGTTLKGFLTVRHIEDNWYFEIPNKMLGRYLLAVSRFTSVPQNFGKFSGEEVNEATVYFEKRDTKTMVMRAFVLSQLADDKDNISKTLKASTADPIVASFKIIQSDSIKDKWLVDVTSLFKRDNNLVGMPTGAFKSLKIGGLQSDRTFIDTLKVFPTNIEVATTRTYGMSQSNVPASETGSVTIGLNTSILLLPEKPMRKRLWDDRVGYFTSRFTLFSDDQHKTEKEQFISRYRLVPKDVKAYQRGQLVEPVKQIVYYIDPATPKKWVPYLIKGINDWNVAFEAAGFKNAIVGKEWPKDRPDMSVDDARYCVLRYLPAEIENAYGPCVTDPRSGEIMESHICWYHNVMNLLTKWYMVQCGPLDKRAQKMQFDDKLMGELIRFVSSHEVGHTLGLRHNMGGSHATPVEKLRDKAWVEAHGHTVSIMDYARFNYVAQPEDHISEKGLFPRINDYDKWAIKWGYQYRPEFKDEFIEKKKLMTETTAVLEKNPRLWFGGEGRNEDPRAQTEDLGDDNVKASEYGIKNLKRIMTNLPQWTKQPDYQYDDLREMYKAVGNQFSRYLGHVVKNIGGHYINNMPGTKPVEIAPAYKQKEAVEYIGRNVFEAPLWLFPQDIMEKTGENAITSIGTLQNMMIERLLKKSLLNSIYNDSFMDAKAYKLSDYLDDVFATVWKPLKSETNISDNCRRSLERGYLDTINGMINPSDKAAPAQGLAALIANLGSSVKTDINLYLEQNLNKVEEFCKAQLAASDGLNKLHYQDLMNQIKLIRERRTTVK